MAMRDGVLEGTGGGIRDKPPACDDDRDRARFDEIAHGTVVLTVLWPTSPGDPTEGGGSRCGGDCWSRPEKKPTTERGDQERLR